MAYFSERVLLVVIVIEVKVLSSWGRRTVVTSAAAGKLLLRGDEVDNGADDCAVFGLTVLPVHRSRILNFLLQQGVQLLFQTLSIKHMQGLVRSHSGRLDLLMMPSFTLTRWAMRAGHLNTIHWSTATVSSPSSFWIVMSPPKNSSENGDTSVQSYRKIWGRGSVDG